MKLLRLQIENFRNHINTHVTCSLNSNVFSGNNGEGKTNVLEAVSFLCLTKSFYAATDNTALRFGQPHFHVEGEFQSDQGVHYAVRVTYDGATNAKHVLINNAAVGKLSTVVGQFPIVVLSPENNAITFGGPGDRRKFMDLVIAQASKSYFEDLLEYRKVLRQRNKILSDAKQTRADCSTLLEPWNETLVTRGAKIVLKRREFVKEFRPQVEQQFAELVGQSEIPGVAYASDVGNDAQPSLGEIERALAEGLKQRYGEERRTGTTLVGPHRDELEFTLNNTELRRFASQGQHKTFLVSLKLAEFFYLQERCRETPLLLLDDVFGELDEHRAVNVLRRTASMGQTFITTTDDRILRHYAQTHYQQFTVAGGRVSNGETIAIAQ
ncbi:MAG: DNA replication/repair protein RecF [Ignavibacteriales bacterium]|nr:DNA replication/repair protein RecF [Ignavibacteriales bacterium]